MIVPVDAERDEQGYWTHPALSGSGGESAADFHDWLSSQGLQCFVMCMCDEAPELFSVRSGGEEPDARDWMPEPPDDDGWFLGSVHDTHYGPACYWLRHIRTG